LKTYKTFAIVRDPYKRFQSSVSQYFKMYRKKHIRTFSPREICDEAARIVDTLTNFQAKGNRYLPPEYIHFQRQVDYIRDNGNRLVKNLYDVDNTNQLIDDFFACAGQQRPQEAEDEQRKANRSMVYKNDLIRITMEGVKPIAGPMLRAVLSKECRDQLRNNISTPRSERLANIFESDRIQKFVESYYRDDIELVSDVKREATTKPRSA